MSRRPFLMRPCPTLPRTVALALAVLLLAVVLLMMGTAPVGAPTPPSTWTTGDGDRVVVTPRAAP